MAKRSTRKKQAPKPSIPPEVFGLVMLALGLLTGLSMLSISRGAVTEQWLRLLRGMVGWGMYGIPFILAGMGIWLLRLFAAEDVQERWEKPVGVLFLYLLLLAFFHLLSPGAGLTNLDQPGGGGLAGWAIGSLLVQAVGEAGSYVLLIALAVLGIVLVSGLSLAELMSILGQGIENLKDWQRRRELSKIDRQPVSPMTPEDKKPSGLLQQVLASRERESGSKTPEAGVKARAGKRETVPTTRSAAHQDEAEVHTSPSGVLYPRVVGEQVWRLPPLESIFEEGVEQEVSQQEIREQVRIIEETLASFGIEAKVREINQGPAVTQFGIEPGYMNTKDPKGRARKVRVSRIVNLSNDIALALSASPIRIEAPIPGRPFVGIEVPNVTTSLVSLRSIMESEAFSSTKWPLRFALGRDVAGQPIVADLASTPHLLIAGATGSGKSVCINAIIACLLTTHTPETLRLLMVDPKMVELISYTGIPHLLAPVVVDLERVVGVLNWATREMDRRYRIFSKLGVRNLVGYNELMADRGEKPMPYIVVVIDELADLMMTAPDEIERTITRIAQMARATGIHLVIATQRPSTDVVTGLIKANFPARVAFAVTSQIDSRVILDTPGAERLLGRGDMLYMSPDSSKLQRLQGVYVSDRELSRLVRYWKGSHVAEEPGFRPVDVSDPSSIAFGSGYDAAQAVQPPLWPDLEEVRERTKTRSDEDDLLSQAIELVRSQDKASISLLQRRLRIGYARAARLIDLMEERGIIGPDQGGGRSRQVLQEVPDGEDWTEGQS